MDGFIDTATNPQTVATVLTFLAALATVLTLVLPLLQSDKLQARLNSVATRREELRAKNREELRKSKEQKHQKGLRHNTGGVTKQIVEALDLRKLMEAPGMRERLAMAGLRTQAHLSTYLFFRFIVPILLAIGTMVYVFLFTDNPTTFQKVGYPFGAVVVGYYLPAMFIQNIISKRQQSIGEAWPDALDLLLICVESGMSIEQAFAKVAAEIGDQSVELVEEMGLTTAELSYLPDRKTAYENLAKRTGLPAVQGVCTALVQAERYGTPLGAALRVMANESRTMRMQEAEKKAAALPAKLTVPMIAFFMPALFIVILGPAALRFMAMN